MKRNDVDITQSRAPRVLLGVTGGIAAYKACELLRVLQKAGCEVRVVMTEHATEFVGPTTFRTLSGAPVAIANAAPAGEPLAHLNLAEWADVMVIAPATANTMAKIAQGVADDLLSTTALATTAPLVVAPAMNTAMWANPRTQSNIDALKSAAVSLVMPEVGHLACGDCGAGKLAPVDSIAERVLLECTRSQALAGRKVVITAGPTRAPLDPVRFLTNRSSGRMGYALAATAARMGAEVTLVSGPTSLATPYRVARIDVETTPQMAEATLAAAQEADYVVATAAVCDFAPAHPADQKLKKGAKGEPLIIELLPQIDIVAEVASRRRRQHKEQVVVGFAAETSNLEEAMYAKFKNKDVDYVIGNVVGEHRGFEARDNEIFIYDGTTIAGPYSASKEVLALSIWEYLLKGIENDA